METDNIIYQVLPSKKATSFAEAVGEMPGGAANSFAVKKKERSGRHPFDKRRKRERVVSCVKCGHDGHVYRECDGPITSFGIIAFRPRSHKLPAGPLIRREPLRCAVHSTRSPDNIAQHVMATGTLESSGICYLMVQRKDTMGYIDFIRGRWPEHDPIAQRRVLATYLQEMTCEERARLRSLDFESLWDLVWTNHSSRIYINEGLEAKAKYENLDIAELLSATACCWTEQEYGFPKGRKNMYESNLDCAKREFREETGYNNHQYRILSETPWAEEFVGTNGVAYRHIYYVAELLTEDDPTRVPLSEITKQGEIANMAWFTYEQCLKVIRPYDTAKKELITAIHKRFKKFY